MHEIKFGTDGWRGVISDDFTFENVIRVAQAIADYFKKTKPSPLKFIVGYDTRFLSDKYAELVSKILSANGIEVILSDRAVPTPVVSFIAKKRGLSAGVMITASHNPAVYNGIKIKTHLGQAAGIDITKGVEEIIKDYDPDIESVKSVLMVKADPREISPEERKRSVKKLAGAIAHSLEENKEVVIRCFGNATIGKAAKALAIARGYVATRGPDLYCWPNFIVADMNGNERTGIAFFAYTNEI